jgi:hypothetical protein
MVRAIGWHDGMNPMTFIMIVREFTAVNLAEAKDLLDRVRRGEAIDLRPYEPGRAEAFAEKLLLFSAIDRAEVIDA